MLKAYNIDKLIKNRQPDQLLFEPVIIKVKDFNEEGVDKFSKELDQAHHTGQPIIPVLIDSWGGSVYGLLGMMDQIERSKVPVITVVEAKAMSAGAILFAMGRERYVAPGATLMLHDVSCFAYGKTTDVVVVAKEMERLSKLIFKKIAKNCGKKSDYFAKLIKTKDNADLYLSPNEARLHNLATKIGVPRIETSVKVEIKLV